MSGRLAVPMLHQLRSLLARREGLTPDAELIQRYLDRREEMAFATLVQRHGPMVLNVCRSVLHHQDDAEDAFQATFVVLATKAGAVRRRDGLASCGSDELMSFFSLALRGIVPDNSKTRFGDHFGQIMAKAFSTIKLLKGKEPFLRRIVCEVRFQDGQLYLDHTGRLLKKLVRDPAWVISPEPTPQGTTVFHMIESLRLSFSMHSASLDLDWSNSDEIIDSDEADRYVVRAEETLGTVTDELEVTEFERLGFRQWYYFSFDRKEETEQWLRALGLFFFPPNLPASFDATPEAAGVSLIMQGQESHYRIALNGIERAAQLPMGDTSLNVRASAVSKKQKTVLLEALKQKRQKQINGSFAVVLDIDTYRNEPRELDLNRFLVDCLKSNLERFRNALPNEDDKKGK